MAFEDKAPWIQEAMRQVAPHGENLGTGNQKCAWCGEDASEFKDELSKKEFGISGMCQTCQDDTFKEE